MNDKNKAWREHVFQRRTWGEEISYQSKCPREEIWAAIDIAGGVGQFLWRQAAPGHWSRRAIH